MTIQKSPAPGEEKYPNVLSVKYGDMILSGTRLITRLTNNPASNILKTITCQIANPEPGRCMSKRLLSINVKNITKMAKNIIPEKLLKLIQASGIT